MHIIVNTTSMTPIYEQIMEQIKAAILKKELLEGSALPSVRALSKELKISALTVKKAYDNLEQEGFIVTVHGKGSFVTKINPELIQEEIQKEIESDLIQVIQKSKKNGISEDELRSLFEVLLDN